MSALHDDTTGAQLSAWLDHELPADEAFKMETAVQLDGTLRKSAAEFRQCDALLREWYADLPAEESARPLAFPLATAGKSRRAARWAFFSAAGVAVAAVAIVLFAFPSLQGRHAQTLAQYAMDKTAEALSRTRGMTADVHVAIVRHLDTPDENGNTEEKRTASGRITFANIAAPRLKFISTEHWDAVGKEMPLTREWGQSDDEQWLSESQGGSTNAFSLQQTFATDDQTPLVTFSGDRDDGSPVDVRTRQAVEGLATLVRSFSRDRFLSWMGCQWTFAGGTGVKGDAWLYTVQPFAKNGATASPTVWTLRLWSGRADGVIDGVDLEESVSNAATGALEQSFRTTYSLKLSDVELETSHVDKDAAPAASKDDGGF